jgi:superfamily II DNA or RNA helicase
MYNNKHTSQIKKHIQLIQEKYPIQLRPYQEEIVIETFQNILENISNKNKSSILIEAPTGAGKTVIGLMIVKILETFYYPNCKTNWCAMRRELLHQAKDANCDVFKFDNSLNYVSLFANEVPSGKVLVMDEAHHDSTFSGANIHKMSQAEIVIGLTATPARSDQVDLYFIKKIHSANTQRLVNEGYLMSYDHYFISEWNLDLIVESYLNNREFFGQTVFFVKNYSECEELTLKLKENGINVEMIHSKLKNNLREQYIKDFKNKNIDCLVNINVLTEGFDYDDLKTVYCRPSQKSLTKQMAGRALRLSDLFSNVNIVQSTDTFFKYFNEVKPNKTFKYYTKSSSWKNDDLDLKEIDNFIDSQNMTSMIDLQKKNGLNSQANAVLQNLEKRLKENKNYELSKKAKRELEEYNLEYYQNLTVINLIEDTYHQKNKLIKKGEPYIEKYDIDEYIEISKRISLNETFRISKILSKRRITDEDIKKLKENKIKKVQKNEVKSDLSLDEEISKIQMILNS